MSIHRPLDPRVPVPAAKPQWSVRRPVPAAAKPALTTLCQITWLTRRGEVEDEVRMVPGTPLFREALGAVVHGGIVATTSGPVAVEDLIPGDEVLTSDGPRTLLWKGSQTFVRTGRARMLYRIPADALGLGRPMPDLLLGPGARILSRRGPRSALTGGDAALVPVSTLVDGMTVIEISPVSAVQTFHLGFGAHCAVAVNGVEIESMHPGRLDASLGEELVSLYRGLFPHLSRPADFRPVTLPRLSDALTGEIDAA